MALTRATDKIIANADGNLNLSGIVTASSFSGGSANLSGIVTASSFSGSGANLSGINTAFGNSSVNTSGIITASSFFGDGSNLTNLPAGLGTALSSTQTSPLNKIYFTDRVLSIGSTVTVDHPATATGAYTQYSEITIEDDADLIIADGDDLIPDILGLGDTTTTGAGGSGRLRIDTITNKTANGAPNFPNGLTGTAGTFTGAINAASATITGNLGVGGVLTYEDVTNIDSVGVITARDGLRVTGIATVSSLEIADGTTTVNKHSVGIGTTTTAGRNAGVSTATGTINFNTTLQKLEYYNGNVWLQINDNRFNVQGGSQSTFGNYTLFTFTSNGNFTVTGSGSIDILVVAGGGQGGLPDGNSNYGGGGGAGGLVWYTGFQPLEQTYSIVVGAGGAETTSGSGNRRGNDGANSTAFGLTALGGGGGAGQGGTIVGRDGGSGGGGSYANGSGGSATQPSQSNALATGSLVYNLGNNGGPGNNSPNGGGGGGGAGSVGYSGNTSNTCHGGSGYNMSSLLGTSVGDNGWFSGGGGGIQQAGGVYVDPYGNGGQGNFGGGGRGARYNTNTQTAGQANTGGGGGGGSNGNDSKGGGSGVVIIRVLTSSLT